MRYQSTRKSVYSTKYHVIWCPKYRQRVIGGRVEARLKQIIDEAVTECGGDVIECETMPDHVHLLLELPPTVPLSALMQKMKGRSSRRLWAEFPQLRRLPALWSPSWFVSTVGGAPLDVARRYVRLDEAGGGAGAAARLDRPRAGPGAGAESVVIRGPPQVACDGGTRG